MKLLKGLCEELGVKIGEEWEGEWTTGNRYTNYSKFKFTETELMCYRKDHKSWVVGNSFLSDLIYGRLKPIWKPKKGETYYTPYINAFNHSEVYIPETWGKDRWYDQVMWDRCMVFKTKEEAIDCAINMIELAKHGI